MNPSKRSMFRMTTEDTKLRSSFKEQLKNHNFTEGQNWAEIAVAIVR